MKYFRHDIDSHNNPKLRKVIRTHGGVGYGVWWMLLELLYEEGNEHEPFLLHATELWLEDTAERIYIADYQILIRIFDTFAEVGLIDSQLWAKRLIFSPEFVESNRAQINQRSREKQVHQYVKHRKDVYKRDKYTCVYCGAIKDLSLDHVLPLSKGGSNDPMNLVTACVSCNSRKKDRTPEEWQGDRS
jgi:hypothetical protein